MALTLRSNGNNPINIVGASWFNDFYNALTGVMTDQPYTLNYRPASSTSTAALTLETNGNAPLLNGLNAGGSTMFTVAAGGEVQSHDHFTVTQPGSGNSWLWLLRLATPTGATVVKEWIELYEGGSGELTFYNNTDGISALIINPNGTVYFGNNTSHIDQNGAISYGSIESGGGQAFITYDNTNHGNTYWTPQSGASHNGHVWLGWNGSARTNLLAIGGSTNWVGANAWIDEQGNTYINGTLSSSSNTGSSFTNSSAGNADLFFLHRSAATAAQFNIGIDNGGSFYIWDNNNGAMLVSGARAVANVTGAGHIPIMSTGGGGNSGRVIWVGTTDPGGSAVEGDIWIKA